MYAAGARCEGKSPVIHLVSRGLGFCAIFFGGCKALPCRLSVLPLPFLESKIKVKRGGGVCCPPPTFTTVFFDFGSLCPPPSILASMGDSLLTGGGQQYPPDYEEEQDEDLTLLFTDNHEDGQQEPEQLAFDAVVSSDDSAAAITNVCELPTRGSPSSAKQQLSVPAQTVASSHLLPSLAAPLLHLPSVIPSEVQLVSTSATPLDLSPQGERMEVQPREEESQPTGATGESRGKDLLQKEEQKTLETCQTLDCDDSSDTIREEENAEGGAAREGVRWEQVGQWVTLVEEHTRTHPPADPDAARLAFESFLKVFPTSVLRACSLSLSLSPISHH